MSPRRHTVDSLAKTPNSLAPWYKRFDVEKRLLLTGHSHQAWPDVAFEGQQLAWNDAAEHVDDKWPLAFGVAERVRRGFARLLGDDLRNIVLGTSTHELVIRFLSALPLERRPRLITTDGEFHTVRRQLDRLAETGHLEVMKVAARPATTLAERVAAVVDPRAAAVLISSVLFENAAIVPGLDRLAAACREAGTELLVDAYHHLNAVPFDVETMGLGGAFIVGGGYKYCQLGEGNCFLRVPEGCRLRPVITGWFAEFERLEAAPTGGVAYPDDPGARFAGATYDPTSHYRGAEVFDFFAARGLTPELLRQVSRHQREVLCRAFDALDLPPALVERDRTTPGERFAGFLALRSPRAAALCAGLARAGVLADSRGDVLRLGPAPYLADAQLEEAVAKLGEVAQLP